MSSNNITNKTKDQNIVGVLDKALSVISVLSDTKEGLGLTKIAELAGINKTTCYRILYTLKLGQLVEDGEKPGTYRLGLGFMKLGAIVQKRINLRQLALPVLTRLTKKTEDTSFLCMLNNYKSVCIEKIEGKHVQVLAMNIGDSWPLYTGAAPRAILAFLEDQEINEILSQPIVPETPKTVTNPEKIWEMIKEIRIKGYSVSYEDVTIGVSSIGAPIFNYQNKVIGAISLSSISQRLPKEEEEQFGNLVIKSAREISELMGWDPSMYKFWKR